MDQQTNVQVVGIAAILAAIVMFAFDKFFPGLLEVLPTGSEATIAGAFAVALGSKLSAKTTVTNLTGK